MKTIAKLSSIIIGASAALAAGTAYADDPQLQNRLARERAQQEAAWQEAETTTVGVYVNHRGLYPELTAQPEETHFEWRQNPHGGGYGAYVAGPRP
jgi:hypothetical protein